MNERREGVDNIVLLHFSNEARRANVLWMVFSCSLLHMDSQLLSRGTAVVHF